MILIVEILVVYVAHKLGRSLQVLGASIITKKMRPDESIGVSIAVTMYVYVHQDVMHSWQPSSSVRTIHTSMRPVKRMGQGRNAENQATYTDGEGKQL